MQLNKETNSAKYQITKYGVNSITVNEQEYTTAIIVMPNYVAAWTAKSIQSLKDSDLQIMLDLKPELVLLGTGAELIFPDPKSMQILFKQGIGLEVMTTAAACRTYAALTSEGRNVLAALIIAADL